MTTWAMNSLEGAELEKALKQAAVVWVGNDPVSAMRWAESITEERVRNLVLVEMAFELVRIRPEWAISVASGMPCSRMRDELLVHAFREWVAIETPAAREWASRLPESRLRQDVLSALAVSLSVDHGRDAAEIVARSLERGGDQDQTAVLVARGWGRSDPRSAIEWVAAFPDPALREAALREVAAGWLRQSPSQVSDWLGSLEDEALRRQMLVAVRSAQEHAGEMARDPVVGEDP